MPNARRGFQRWLVTLTCVALGTLAGTGRAEASDGPDLASVQAVLAQIEAQVIPFEVRTVMRVATDGVDLAPVSAAIAAPIRMRAGPAADGCAVAFLGSF